MTPLTPGQTGNTGIQAKASGAPLDRPMYRAVAVGVGVGIVEKVDLEGSKVP